MPRRHLPHCEGLAEDVCVLATVLDARAEGFAVSVIAAGTRPVTPAGGAAAPAFNRTTLSQQFDAKKRMGFGAGRGQGEGRLKFLTLKNLDVID